MKLMTFIRAHMKHGHFKADLDPLKLAENYEGFEVTQRYSHPDNK